MPDIVIVDYISLLAGADGEDQWRKLGQIARYAARYADIHRKVVVLCAQVSEDDKIRYAKSLKEHAAIMWSFVATKETKEQGILNYNVQKSRGQVDKPFSMSIDYALSRVKDLEDSSGEPSAKKPSKDVSMMPDLTEGD
jgi:hypothetical protein